MRPAISDGGSWDVDRVLCWCRGDALVIIRQSIETRMMLFGDGDSKCGCFDVMSLELEQEEHFSLL